MNPFVSVLSGTTTTSFFVLPDYWVIVNPGSGATATVEYTTGTANDVAGSHATWVTQGAYTTRTALKVEEDLQGLYFRITAASGSIDYSVNGELSEADRLTLRSYAKAVVNQLGVGSASAAALAPVSLNVNTTLTRAAHYNRQIVVTTAGAVTLTATGTDALIGDFISIDVVGGGSVTLAGVTSQAGYSLTAVSGGTVEAKCQVDASLIAITPAVDPATVSLSGAYTLTSADDRKTLTCTTALTVSVPNGLSPAPSTIHFPPATGNLTLTPTGGATFNGSTASLTRAFASNRLGVSIMPNPYTANDYSVSGS